MRFNVKTSNLDFNSGNWQESLVAFRLIEESLSEPRNPFEEIESFNDYPDGYSQVCQSTRPLRRQTMPVDIPIDLRTVAFGTIV